MHKDGRAHYSHTVCHFLDEGRLAVAKPKVGC